MNSELLYSWVKDLPIVDWHNHLDMRMLAEDKPLGSLYEVWVKADPYKHRAMRICGEPESVITGDASEKEKWAAWLRTLPKLVGNPLFAWAEQELAFLRGMGNGEWGTGNGEQGGPQSSAAAKWWEGEENISLADWTPLKMLAKFNVEYISPCVGADCENVELWNCGNMETANEDGGLKIVPSLRMNAVDEVDMATLERFNAAGCRVIDISVDDVSQLTTHNSQLSRRMPRHTAGRCCCTSGHCAKRRSVSAQSRVRRAASPECARPSIPQQLQSF